MPLISKDIAKPPDIPGIPGDAPGNPSLGKSSPELKLSEQAAVRSLTNSIRIRLPKHNLPRNVLSWKGRLGKMKVCRDDSLNQCVFSPPTIPPGVAGIHEKNA
jgi:hypothetical protein